MHAELFSVRFTSVLIWDNVDSLSVLLCLSLFLKLLDIPVFFLWAVQQENRHPENMIRLGERGPEIQQLQRRTNIIQGREEKVPETQRKRCGKNQVVMDVARQPADAH